MLNRTPYGGNPLLTEDDRPPNGDTSEGTTTTPTTPTTTTTTTTMEPTTTALPRESFVLWKLESSVYNEYSMSSHYVNDGEECRSLALIAKSKHLFYLEN